MPKCIYCQNCGNEFLAKYKTSKYCSRKCSNIGTAKLTNETNRNKTNDLKSEIKLKKNNSLIEKYGSLENWYKIQNELSSRTKELKYGNPTYNNSDKRQQTFFERYGIKFPMQHKEFFIKATLTKIKLYGELSEFNISLDEKSINCINKAIGIA